MRMTDDLVKDLELDQIFIKTLHFPSDDQLECVRAYVSSYYILSTQVPSCAPSPIARV